MAVRASVSSFDALRYTSQGQIATSWNRSASFLTQGSNIRTGSRKTKFQTGLRFRSRTRGQTSVVSSFTMSTDSEEKSTSEVMEKERVGSVRQLLAAVVAESLKTSFTNLPELPNLPEPQVTICANPKFGDYQCNNAMGIWAKIKPPPVPKIKSSPGGKTKPPPESATTPENTPSEKTPFNEIPYKNPNDVGQAIMKNLPPSPLIGSTSIAGPGFVNIVLSDVWLEERVRSLLVDGLDRMAPVLPYKRAVVDFSSPNIAKEMHVGHLRSTIIGDTIARMLEYCQVEVLRRNHVGDWGTQFGMLIEFLFEQNPDWEHVGEQAIGDLQAFYKKAKMKFDEDAEFKVKAQQAVVALQGGEPKYRKAWAKICDISRNEFAKVYQRLTVEVEERGESFYNPYIKEVVAMLEEKGMVTESQGARCIFFEAEPEKKAKSEKKKKEKEKEKETGEGEEEGEGGSVEGGPIPLILVKSDGGFNYATTDMTCLWYRLNEEKAEWIIYVTDIGQAQHFDMVFKAGAMAQWWSPQKHIPRVSHVGFGLVLGSDGKRFRTRSTEVVRLVDLLDEAVDRARKGLQERGKAEGWGEKEVEEAAEAMGYGAVKYADLKNNRLTNYTFDFDQMLDMRGNTAVYLLYAHARICSIIRKSGKDMEELKTSRLGSLRLEHPSERALAVALLRLPETVELSLRDLMPNALCEYLYNLAECFTTFYTECQVVGSVEEESRLLLCESVGVVMRQTFKLLGITPLYRL